MISEVGQIFNDPTLNSLKLVLEVSAKRHDALASNIANYNTPGYHRVDLSSNFKNAFSVALRDLDEGKPADELAVTSPQIAVDDKQNIARMDGNTVNLEQETTEVIKNQSDFDFAGRLLALKYSGLRAAISGTVS